MAGGTANAKKQWWAKIHAIQAERNNCSLEEAKAILKGQNGSATVTKPARAARAAKASPVLAASIDDVAAMAEARIAELGIQLETTTNLIADLKSELARWQSVLAALQPNDMAPSAVSNAA